MMSSAALENPCTSAEAIQFHYDIGNEFYELWLGPTLAYSCAIWEPGDDLESAQHRKLDFHARQARVEGARRVLDVGCGWGAMLKRLVQAHQVGNAVGLTLSSKQAAWITGLGDSRIEARVESWRDHQPEGPYDAIISVEAFEHFAKPGLSPKNKVNAYREFFQSCHRWLKPGGWLSLQTSIYSRMEPEKMSRFFLEVFPETDLPTLTDVAEASKQIFEMVQLRDDRHDHERTCRTVLNRLRANRAAAVSLTDEATVARYDKYLAFLTIGFRLGNIGLLRIAFRRIDHVG
jgi:cyclopropane-fatty-acyl-phospholipid synthase